MGKDTQASLLGHLPPHVRNETLRRVAVVKRYLRDRNRKNAERSAAELGLSLVHFKKLVHVWELHGRADRMPGADWPKTKSTATTDEQLSILREAAVGDRSATVEAVVKAAIAIAAARGIVMPSRGTMRARVQELRGSDADARPNFGSDATLVVVHAALNIPVHHAGGATMPVAALVVEPTTRAVLGIGLSITGPDAAATAGALAGALTRLPIGIAPNDAATPVRLAMDVHDGPEWLRLAAEVTAAGAAIIGERRPLPRRDLAIAYLGRKVGGIEIRPRQVTRPPTARTPYIASGQAPLTLIEAAEFAQRRLVPLVRPSGTSVATERLRSRLVFWSDESIG